MLWYLVDTAVLSIISRLRSIELGVWIYCEKFYEINDAMTAKKNNIRKIFRALPEYGFLNLEFVICNSDATPMADEAETVKALSFWIKLSDETKKPIRIYARMHRHNHQHEATAITRQAFDQLGNEEEFTGATIEHFTNHSILHFNNARITLFFKIACLETVSKRRI